MVLHDINEWRDLPLGLEWDLKLMEGIFYQLSSEIYPNQLEKSLTSHTTFHDFFFTKSQVIVGLEKSKGFLEKRPCLRMLHTHLACLTSEAEGTCVENFIRFRLEEKKINFKMIQDILTKKIYMRLQKTQEFLEKIKEFKENSKQNSIWCVRDFKNLHRKPSQFYKVHVLPPKKRPQRLIDLEKQLIQSMSKQLIDLAVSENITKYIDSIREQVLDHQTRKHQQLQGQIQQQQQQQQQQTAQDTLDSTNKSGIDSNHRIKRWRAGMSTRGSSKNRKEQIETEAKKKNLRLQILSPNRQKSREQTTFGTFDTLVSSISSSSMATTSEQQVNEQFLALVEANGDLQLARKLLNQKILLSGFRRAIDQAKDLDVDIRDQWELVKIWRKVYRTHTYQAMQCVKFENQFWMN